MVWVRERNPVAHRRWRAAFDSLSGTVGSLSAHTGRQRRQPGSHSRQILVQCLAANVEVPSGKQWSVVSLLWKRRRQNGLLRSVLEHESGRRTTCQTWTTAEQSCLPRTRSARKALE